MSAENNQSVIITPEKKTVEAKYESVLDGLVDGGRSANSGVWRDKNGNCHNPKCDDDFLIARV
jgi:hypothetical protein